MHVQPLQRSAKRRGCLLSYSQAEPGRELTQPSPRLLAEPCTSLQQARSHSRSPLTRTRCRNVGQNRCTCWPLEIPEKRHLFTEFEKQAKSWVGYYQPCNLFLLLARSECSFITQNCAILLFKRGQRCHCYHFLKIMQLNPTTTQEPH